MPIIDEEGQRFVCYLHTNFSTQSQEIKKCVSTEGEIQTGLRDNQNNLLKSSDGFYFQIAVKSLVDSQSNTLVSSDGYKLITA